MRGTPLTPGYKHCCDVRRASRRMLPTDPMMPRGTSLPGGCTLFKYTRRNVHYNLLSYILIYIASQNCNKYFQQLVHHNEYDSRIITGAQKSDKRAVDLYLLTHRNCEAETQITRKTIQYTEKTIFPFPFTLNGI